jgi:deazaflavin-dependent oxidoreductase (nitroreductase family)
VADQEVTTFNQRVIAEFRANGGVVGGMFVGAPMLLLTTAGARTGKPHTNPAVYHRDGERLLVYGSNAGGPRHPDWFHNLLADPQVTVEIGELGVVRMLTARAEPLRGAERDRCYAAQADRDPAFREYQANTTRTIPVVALWPLELTDPARGRAIADQLVQHHNELRAEFSRARSAIDDLLSGPTGPSAEGIAQALGGRTLLGHCLTFCYHLRTHHLREDGAFSAFRARFPELGTALNQLSTEHRRVADALAGLEVLLEQLAMKLQPAELERLRDELERLGADLEDHFRYEEAELLPRLHAAAR